MDLETLATVVDDLVHIPGAERVIARLYGVRLFGDDDGEAGRVLLDELGRGYAREVPRRVRPPAGLAAVALTTTGWGAPLAVGGNLPERPSRHPERRRIHVTALVGGDGEDVSVLRFADDDEPMIVRGGIGVVHDLLVRCWNRRADAPAGRGRRHLDAPPAA